MSRQSFRSVLRRYHSVALAAFAALVLTVPAGPAGAATADVEIRDFEFSPKKVVVKAGDVVEWENFDDEDHTVTAEDDSFDRDALEPGSIYRRVFTEPGNVDYRCTIHDDMDGVVVVLAGAGDPDDPDPPASEGQDGGDGGTGDHDESDGTAGRGKAPVPPSARDTTTTTKATAFVIPPLQSSTTTVPPPSRPAGRPVDPAPAPVLNAAPEGDTPDRDEEVAAPAPDDTVASSRLEDAPERGGDGGLPIVALAVAGALVLVGAGLATRRRAGR